MRHSTSHDITSGKPFTLNGILRRVKNLQGYIDQVTNYCFNNNIEYAIVSNGLQYVIFRAVRIDGIHIGRGRVKVFNGDEDLAERFVGFWELLSKSSVESGSLKRAFEDSGPHQCSTAGSQIKSMRTRKRLQETD